MGMDRKPAGERKSLRDLVEDELRRQEEEAPDFATVEMGSATYTKMLGKRYSLP